MHTALAMMLAEELHCAWEQVRVEQSPIDPIYANLTVGRDAGALARATLLNAAVDEWELPREEGTVNCGAIRGGDRSVRFGELVARGRILTPATTWTRKEPSAY